MKMSEKVIVVDCDGVLVDWVFPFDEFMLLHGYKKVRHDCYEIHLAYDITYEESKQLIRVFNETAAIAWLPPMRDAMFYVDKLHREHGYIFHCVTSLSKNPYAQVARKENLHRLFGETAFAKIICLDTGADKDEALIPYENSGCFFVEDKVENAVTGDRMGLKSILLQHDHNTDFYHGRIPVVPMWKDIYNIITK